MKKWGTVILFIYLWTISFVYGQNALWMNDNMLVHVESGALLHVDGDVTHQNAGVMDNSGTVELNRDWINNSGFGVLLNNSPGIVVMNGFNQRFLGNSTTNFYDLDFIPADADAKGDIQVTYEIYDEINRDDNE